jgi:hypothetical protein
LDVVAGVVACAVGVVAGEAGPASARGAVWQAVARMVVIKASIFIGQFLRALTMEEDLTR